QSFRGFTGGIASGSVVRSQDIRVLPSGRTTRIERIVTADGDVEGAVAGQSRTVTFTHEVDCWRGDVIPPAHAPLEVAAQFKATIVWMDEQELLPGRGYWLKLGTQTVTATVQQ